jgi:hypothetical protein
VSRKLLEAVPGDQEILDKAELLREFVFSCPSQGEVVLDGPSGTQVPVQVRARGFGGAKSNIDLTEGIAPPPPRKLTPELENVLRAVRELAIGDKYNSAKLAQVKKALARSAEPYDECRDLHGLGFVSLQKIPGKWGDFWIAKPFAEPRRVFDVDFDTVRKRIGQVARECRKGKLPPFYEIVRDRFDWPTSDGGDALLPRLKQLQEEGVVILGATSTGQTTVDVPRQQVEPQAETETPVAPKLLDHDFSVLNALEEIEAKRINFGVFDGWTSAGSLARAGRLKPEDVTAALARLHANGYLMLAADGRIRSRIAELAREVRYVKQRFKANDADKRPFLVRSLKLELRDRDKPVRSTELNRVLSDAAARAPEAAAPIGAMGKALQRLWGEEAELAGFQARGIEAVLLAWFGKGSETLAISADTGSGKTEAAVLPMIIAARSRDACASSRGKITAVGVRAIDVPAGPTHSRCPSTKPIRSVETASISAVRDASASGTRNCSIPAAESRRSNVSSPPSKSASSGTTSVGSGGSGVWPTSAAWLQAFSSPRCLTARGGPCPCVRHVGHLPHGSTW